MGGKRGKHGPRSRGKTPRVPQARPMGPATNLSKYWHPINNFRLGDRHEKWVNYWLRVANKDANVASQITIHPLKPDGTIDWDKRADIDNVVHDPKTGDLDLVDAKTSKTANETRMKQQAAFDAIEKNGGIVTSNRSDQPDWLKHERRIPKNTRVRKLYEGSEDLTRLKEQVRKAGGHFPNTTNKPKLTSRGTANTATENKLGGSPKHTRPRKPPSIARTAERPRFAPTHPEAITRSGEISAKLPVSIPTKKVGKFRLFAKGLMGFGIGLLIDYVISKLIRSITGDPIKKGFELHIRKLDGAISKAISAQNRDIVNFLEKSPGQTIYVELNLQYVLGRPRMPQNDPDFLGMQLLFVQISIKPHNSSLTKWGLPKSLNKTWTGKSQKDLKRTWGVRFKTVSTAISVALPITGDFYGTWMAGDNSKIAEKTSLWAVFTIRLKSGYLQVSGYMPFKNKTFKDLKITIVQVEIDNISLHVSPNGEKAVKKIYIGTTNTPGFLNGVWDLKVHPDHPNKDIVPMYGQERWFRPKHVGLQQGLSKKIMDYDGVEPLYNEAWKKWKKKN